MKLSACWSWVPHFPFNLPFLSKNGRHIRQFRWRVSGAAKQSTQPGLTTSYKVEIEVFIPAHTHRDFHTILCLCIIFSNAPSVDLPPTIRQSASPAQVWQDNYTYCHTEMEDTYQICSLSQSQKTDTRPTSPSIDPKTPGLCYYSY